MLTSVVTNNKRKTGSTVYKVTADGIFSEDEIESALLLAFPRQYRKSLVSGLFTASGLKTSWLMLKDAKRQTTVSDFDRRLAEVLNVPVTVQVEMGTPALEDSKGTASSRLGTTRSKPNTPRARGSITGKV